MKSVNVNAYTNWHQTLANIDISMVLMILLNTAEYE